MGERVTCGLLGLISGSVAGYIANAGVTVGEPIWLLLLMAILTGAVIGVLFTFLSALSKSESFPLSVLLFGLILGGFAGIVAAIGVVILSGIVPYFLVAAIFGWFAGWLLCWFCARHRDTHISADMLPRTGNHH